MSDVNGRANGSLRVVVCGGRDYEDRDFVFRTLDQIRSANRAMLVIQGGARGADAHARAWCQGKPDVQCHTVEPDWSIGPAAGPIRNQKMLDVYRPDLVLAFPGGRGTADMTRRAQKGGFTVRHPTPLAF
jgi:hypothetical protein